MGIEQSENNLQPDPTEEESFDENEPNISIINTSLAGAIDFFIQQGLSKEGIQALLRGKPVRMTGQDEHWEGKDQETPGGESEG